MLTDDTVHAKFVEVKNQVGACLRKLKKIENKEDLQRIESEISQECQFIDFTQALTDINA